MESLHLLPLQHQSHPATCFKAPSLTATFHPFSEDLQQQHLWKQCSKVVTKTTLRETLQATRFGVVPHPYQPLHLLGVPGQHLFMANCLLHRHFGRGRLFQTKQLTGLLLSVDTQWCMTASTSITLNHQLLSSCLESHAHSVATDGKELTVLMPCWHHSHHC